MGSKKQWKDWRIRLPDPNSRSLLLRLRKANREDFDWRLLIENAIAIPFVLALGGIFFLLPAIGTFRLLGGWPTVWPMTIGVSIAMSFAAGLLGIAFVFSPFSQRLNKGAGWMLAVAYLLLSVVGIETLIEPKNPPFNDLDIYMGGLFLAYIMWHIGEYRRLRREEKQRAERSTRWS